MKYALVLVAALVGGAASIDCSSKMKATFYKDMYCQTVDEDESMSLEGWNEEECEKADEFEGYQTW